MYFLTRHYYNIEQYDCWRLFWLFQTNYALTSINISWNGIGYEGALAVSEMFKVNRYITDVDVRHCRINWKGALLISNGLKQNAILEVLKVILLTFIYFSCRSTECSVHNATKYYHLILNENENLLKKNRKRPTARKGSFSTNCVLLFLYSILD